MAFSNRKIIIGLFSLLVAFALYLVFTWSGGAPKIIRDRSSDDAQSPQGIEQPPGGVGKIGDVGLAAIQQARYTHLNSRKEIDREFGFEKLLHEMGDEWEIEKPFMNIFRRDLECRITADSGKVQMQIAGGKPAPKDASLNGNVVIHIIPTINSDVKESFIYLDDIIFISERSQFSTAGPVKFVNDDARLVGKGLELVYNEQSNRLDYLRIMRLDELSLKIPVKKDESSRGGKLQTAGTVSAADTQITKTEKQPDKPKRGDYYKCSLSGNVIINSPEQVVVADELLINDIFQSKEKKSQRTEGRERKTEDRASEPEDFTDINVSCDNGIVVTPVDSTVPYASTAAPPAEDASERAAKIVGQESKRAAFAADKVDYNMAAGTIVLEGNCLCTGFKQEPVGLRKYTLSGEKITVTLSPEKEKRVFAWGEGVDKVVAEGDVVQLSTARMVDDKVMGFTKLKCANFQFDGKSEQFIAKGPGVIAIDNSKLEQKDKKPRKFGLKRQCYAVVRDFETLTYSLASNQLVADSANGLVIDYFPITNGKTGTQVTINAGHIDGKLLQMPDGSVELMKLTASNGVTYEEKDIQFAGSNLIYDADSSMINIKGDKSQPCLLNGALVDGIKYDLKKNKFKAEVRSPGAIQFK